MHKYTHLVFYKKKYLKHVAFTFTDETYRQICAPTWISYMIDRQREANRDKNHKGRRLNLEEGKSTHLNRESSLHTKITDKNQ